MEYFKGTHLLVVFFMLFSSCNYSSKEKQVKAINALEEELYAAQSLDREKGMHMIDTYVNYAKQYPQDTAAAIYLFKAAEIAMNLQLGSQSIHYYDKIISNYPGYSKIPECIFLKAFIFENELKDLINAEKYYKEFMAQYPQHVLFKDAEASLKFLGKSPEELVKIFQELNESQE